LSLCLLPAVRLAFPFGNPDIVREWTSYPHRMNEAFHSGAVHLGPDQVVQWTPFAKDWEKEGIFSIRFECGKFDRLLFSVLDKEGSAPEEAALLKDALSGNCSTGPVEAEVRIDELGLSVGDSTPVAVPKTPVKLRIWSDGSEVSIKSLTLLSPAGKTLAKAPVGPRVTIFSAWALLVLCSVIVYLLDILAFRLIWKRKEVDPGRSFVAGYAPLMFAFLLLDSGNFFKALPALIPATLFLRTFLALRGSGGREAPDAIGKWFEYGLVFLGTVIFGINHLRLSGVIVADPGPIIAAVVGICAGVALLTFVAQVLLSKSEHSGIALATQWLLLPALSTPVVLISRSIEAQYSVSWFLVCASTFVAFRVAAINKANIRWPALVLLALAITFAFSTEGAFRRSAYGTWFTPMNVGEGFDLNEDLFWAPEKLFTKVDGEDQVEVSFRSGPTSKNGEPGVYRILTMGGSNTWGQWIDKPEDTWSGRLEHGLNQLSTDRTFEVVNGGVRAFSLFQLAILYKLFMDDYRFDMVLLYINLNDSRYHDKASTLTFREQFVLRTGKWDVLDDPELQKAARYRWVVKAHQIFGRSSLYNLLTKSVLHLRFTEAGARVQRDYMKSSNPLPDYRANLDLVIRTAHERGARVVLADEFDYYRAEIGPIKQTMTEIMAEVAKQPGVDFIPVQALMLEKHSRDELVFPWDVEHLNETGSGELAKILAQQLMLEDDLRPIQEVVGK
jgi:lysophospholipase L1-like esterase